MKEYKITYSNNYFNVICIEYINANTKKQATKLFKKQNDMLHYIEIIEIIKM